MMNHTCPTCGRAWEFPEFALVDDALYHNGGRIKLRSGQAKIFYLLWVKHKKGGMAIHEDIIRVAGVNQHTAGVYVTELRNWLATCGIPYEIKNIHGTGYSLRRIKVPAE